MKPLSLPECLYQTSTAELDASVASSLSSGIDCSESDIAPDHDSDDDAEFVLNNDEQIFFRTDRAWTERISDSSLFLEDTHSAAPVSTTPHSTTTPPSVSPFSDVVRAPSAASLQLGTEQREVTLQPSTDANDEDKTPVERQKTLDERFIEALASAEIRMANDEQSRVQFTIKSAPRFSETPVAAYQTDYVQLSGSKPVDIDVTDNEFTKFIPLVEPHFISTHFTDEVLDALLSRNISAISDTCFYTSQDSGEEMNVPMPDDL
eukprot:jgi/Hompol1/4172/HPOL_006964-RA